MVDPVALDPTDAPARPYALADRYAATTGTVVLSGLQAITRVLLDRRRVDEAAGLRTGGLASGYPGSPLGGLDLTFDRARAVLEAHDVRHVPGVNEELAASVVWGTQQPHATGLRSGLQGVFGLWYGKSPGADRCGDVFKHANHLGAHPLGGALAVVGDDPAAKSSSLPSQSETIFYDAAMPVLVPGSVQELLDFGVVGLELSRFSGCWVGLKVVTNIADGVASVDVDPRRLRLDHPELEIDGSAWVHQQRLVLSASMLTDRESDLLRERQDAARAFAAANGLDRIEGATGDAWVGFVAAGKTYYDLRQSLADLGFDEERLARQGVRLLKLGMIHPLDQEIVRRFSEGLDRVVVVEEKRGFLEAAVKTALYDSAHRPPVVGKRDGDGRVLFPYHGELTVDLVRTGAAACLSERLEIELPQPVEERVVVASRRPASNGVGPVAVALSPPSAARRAQPDLVSRTAAYCSGCPHNRSTVVPEGSVLGGGVGCHGMSYMDPRLAEIPKLGVVPMGSEGVPWIGLAPFAATDHIFQHLGDGTFTHSGILAVRACVAAGVNVTFKILYNGYVAMTGGQEVAGGLTVAEITRELEAEGVARIVVCTEDPSRYRRKRGLAAGTTVHHRDDLDALQQELRQVLGVTVLVFDQVCAAEARRLRRSGALPQPERRIVINEAVCEGCGDCSTKSNCLSVQPVDTELGRKTQIHQSSCNSDYSCLLGDCPSFVSLRPARRRPWSRRAVPAPVRAVEEPAADDLLPEPVDPVEVGDGTYAIYMVGIGGTGVVTVNQVVATAALLDGLQAEGLDQTGMSQKAGPVSSHLKLRRSGSSDRAASVGTGEADLYLAFDLLGAASDGHLARTHPDRTAAVVSTSAVPTSSIVTDVGTSFPDVDRLLERITRATRRGTEHAVDAVALAEQELGDHVVANVLLLGVAYQAGLVPLSAASLERAIELNGVAVAKNLAAFRLGRRRVVRGAGAPAVVAAAPEVRLGASPLAPGAAAVAVAEAELVGLGLPAVVAEVAGVRAAELVEYQDAALARRYLGVVARVAGREAEVVGDRHDLAVAVARNLFKLLAYKDEYEVARLHLRVAVRTRAEQRFGARQRLSYQLHPPLLRSMGLDRKIAVGTWIHPVFRALRSARRLRGTRLDVFGWAHLRRIERALVEEYLAAVDRELAGLVPERHQRSVEVAEAPQLVRGYEGVKLASLPAFRRRLAPADAPALGAAPEPTTV